MLTPLPPALAIATGLLLLWAGQAVATAHVPTHSMGAAIYAQQAIHRASSAEQADAAVAKEREWQRLRLIQLNH